MSDGLINRREMLRRGLAATGAALSARTAAARAAGDAETPLPTPAVRPSEPAGWPAANGPYGNFTPRRFGHALVDDLADSRLLWKSDDREIGFAKGSASGYLDELVRRPTNPGSAGGVIVADGKVFASSFRPRGEVWAGNLPHLENLKKPYTGAEAARLRANLRIDADDLAIAFDFDTGKTVWKAVEEGRGQNLYMGKREGFAVAPAWHGGRLFVMGTTGRLYAYESATGKKAWETDIGAAHRAMEAVKQKALAAKVLPDTFGWDANLTVIGGVLIVPLFDHAVDTGLRGVDPATGKTLWEVPAVNSRYATPATFRHEGAEFVLTATRKGGLHLLEPRTGRARWNVEGTAGTWGSLLPGEGFVLVNVGSKEKDTKGGPHGLYGAYRITPDKAERAWTMPDNKDFRWENHMDNVARRKLAVRDGLVWFGASNKAGGTTHRKFHVLRLTTGEVLSSSDEPAGDPLLMPIEDRVLHCIDGSHGNRATWDLFAADEKGWRRLCKPWKPAAPTTTAYEVIMETPYVDGRLLIRTEEGEIHCHDLRKAKA